MTGTEIFGGKSVPSRRRPSFARSHRPYRATSTAGARPEASAALMTGDMSAGIEGTQQLYESNVFFFGDKNNSTIDTEN